MTDDQKDSQTNQNQQQQNTQNTEETNQGTPNFLREDREKFGKFTDVSPKKEQE